MRHDRPLSSWKLNIFNWTVVLLDLEMAFFSGQLRQCLLGSALRGRGIVATDLSKDRSETEYDDQSCDNMGGRRMVGSWAPSESTLRCTFIIGNRSLYSLRKHEISRTKHFIMHVWPIEYVRSIPFIYFQPNVVSVTLLLKALLLCRILWFTPRVDRLFYDAPRANLFERPLPTELLFLVMFNGAV